MPVGGDEAEGGRKEEEGKVEGKEARHCRAVATEA